MAKQTILKERGTGEVLYPHTLASLVKTSDGGNVDEGLDKAKRAVFIDRWNARCATNPAVAALTPAELTQWQQILTAATEKNILFTTP